jgi:hypothetical protein
MAGRVTQVAISSIAHRLKCTSTQSHIGAHGTPYDVGVVTVKQATPNLQRSTRNPAQSVRIV